MIPTGPICQLADLRRDPLTTVERGRRAAQAGHDRTASPAVRDGLA